MPAIHLWSPDDRTLGSLGALALGAAAGTCLVVDLAGASADPPRGPTMATIVADGPTAAQLRPSRAGVAYLPGGGASVADAIELLDAFAVGWPAVVVHAPGRDAPLGYPTVPVLPLVPAGLRTAVDGPAVYQPTAWPVLEHPDGVVLTRPLPGELRRLGRMQRPAWGRWVRSWRKVWSYPWR